MTVIHWPPLTVQVESVEDRDRRDCIALDGKIDGANKELAQWLLRHPSYSATEVGRWLGCAESRIRRLRLWAQNGFEGAYSSQAGGAKHGAAGRPNDPLKTYDNFEDDDMEQRDDVEDAAQVLTNVLDSISDSKSVAEAYRKIFKVSSFDREAKAEIHNAINKLIVKWRTVQSTLAKKGQGNG
jgi:hypothetical protein